MERKRTSKKQFKIYIDYIKSHKILLTGKWSPSNNPEDMEALWRNLTQELNSCGDGPIRDTNGWKKVFTEWKGVCRKKARESKALSELEAEIIKLTGQGAVTGLDLGELGLNPSCSSTKTTTKQPGTSYTLHSEEREQSDEETKPASSPENQPSTSKGTVKNKRSKSKKLVYKQYALYIQFLENRNKDFTELCEELNKVPGGACKKIKEWQEAFWRWKNYVKRKARDIYIDQHLTGGGLPIPIILTELEKKLLAILSVLCIEGMLVPELGFLKQKELGHMMKLKQPTTKKVVKWCYTRKQRSTKKYKTVLNLLKATSNKLENSMYELTIAIQKVVDAMERYFSLS
ncbi:uncharacterized protein isoform X2 [Leptinotarsa decemlineata]|uniref:uncharacterized protein isoform X2 n=1 Tax=Leptinotarsa decemlineata TaxID=7539 RepID=UPI003D30562C